MYVSGGETSAVVGTQNPFMNPLMALDFCSHTFCISMHVCATT